MAKITIDGEELEFEGKKMILQVALDSGKQLPHYCYHPGLSIVASCRICLAEVESPNPRNDNKLELIPKMVPTCQTPAADGMVVHTQSPKSIANQKAVMEYLLINHPLDCPVCDQAGECSLQDYSYQYGRAESRFEEDKIKNQTKDIGPNVKLYSDRCIMCSRCVRFTREVSGTAELGIFGRGNREEIDVAPGKPLDNELSGNVVDLCPVGALLDKDFLFKQRVWNLQKTASIDGITAGGDNISIEHHEGQIRRVKPRSNPDVNKWWISDEIRYGWKFVHDDARLTSPLIKKQGESVETGWDEAYKVATALLGKAAADSGENLTVIVSPMLSCEDAFLLGKLARAINPQALLVVGPVPIDGQDKTFPGGYTVYAEKCPNSRGVTRALKHIDEHGVLSFDKAVQRLVSDESGVVLVTGNYPSEWAGSELLNALEGKSVIAIDTLANKLTEQADLVLPGLTWTEKSGTFENVTERIQAFEQAITPIEWGRSEAQIAIDLTAATGHGNAWRYNAETVRQQLGGAFLEEVHYPDLSTIDEPDIEFVEL